MSDKVIHIESGSQLDSEIVKSGLVVVYFTAQWCGPCRAIGPKISGLSNEFSIVTFLKVDIDIVNDHPLVKQIRSVPTFTFYKNSSKLTEFSGADENKIRSTVQANL